jgi:hypothetical protein
MVEIVLLFGTITDVSAFPFDIFASPSEFEVFPRSAKLVALLNMPLNVRSEF